MVQLTASWGCWLCQSCTVTNAHFPGNLAFPGKSRAAFSPAAEAGRGGSAAGVPAFALGDWLFCGAFQTVLDLFPPLAIQEIQAAGDRQRRAGHCGPGRDLAPDQQPPEHPK